MMQQIKVEVPKAGFYQLLRGGGGIGQPEGHSIALIEPQWMTSGQVKRTIWTLQAIKVLLNTG